MTVERVGLILVEGVFLLRPRLRRYWNFGIWVETGRELREDRLRGRGEHDEGWIDHWILGEDHYLQADVPEAAADVVVHGDRWFTVTGGRLNQNLELRVPVEIPNLIVRQNTHTCKACSP